VGVQRRPYARGVPGPLVLCSTWWLPAPVERCWDVLADPAFTWPRWWPGVTADDVHATAGIVGSSALVTFRGPLGASVRVRLRVEHVLAPWSARLTADGDLRGAADVRLADAPARGARPGGTLVAVRWRVTVVDGWAAGPSAHAACRPLVRRAAAASHAAVMRAGERGLAHHLTGR